jgi:hypothetical protein
MPTLSFNTKFKKNEGLVISPQELLDLYFYGITIKEPNGSNMPISTIKQFILSAQSEIEKWLGIKLIRQVVSEQKDFYRNDWYSWGYIRTTYPCVSPISLDGYIGDVKQISYPTEWLSARKTSDGELYHRHIYLVPSTNSPTSHQVVYTGITPHLSLMGNGQVPNYWHLEYETGFCKIPHDLLNAIGMLAAINIFYIMGDIIMGNPGIGNQSISIDGLSQSLSAKSDGYGARIKGYLEALNGTSSGGGLKEKLYNYYKGFTISSF